MFRMKDNVKNCYYGFPFIAYLKIIDSKDGRSSDNSNGSSESYKSAKSSYYSENEGGK